MRSRLLVWGRMRKHELALKLARSSGVSRARAADQLDRVVNEIVRKLRKGEPARLPGLGTLVATPRGEVHLDSERRRD